MEWVSVSDKLPEQSGWYLIWHPEKSTRPIEAFWSVSDKTWGRDWNRTEFVTHWMPLPEPPKKS